MPKYIDADKLLEEAKRLSGPMTGDGWDNLGVFSLINRQPEVDIEKEWYESHKSNIEKYGFGLVLSTKCNKCGKVVPDLDYCGYCGAQIKHIHNATGSTYEEYGHIIDSIKLEVENG